MPVSTRTRPAGVSTRRQFSAWSKRCSSSISSVTRRFQGIRGTGPKSAPASDRNEPARINATRVPPPRSAAQSTASLIDIVAAPPPHPVHEGQIAQQDDRAGGDDTGLVPGAGEPRGEQRHHDDRRRHHPGRRQTASSHGWAVLHAVAPQPPGFLPFEKSRWNAEAVGSDWPWYFEPSSGEPDGRSNADDILTNASAPILIPW